jgi:hypothetical protein
MLKWERRPEELPTPLQLRFLIELLIGGYGTLWNWFTYRTSHRERKRGNNLVAWAATVLAVCLTLSVCIFLADTFLHLTTTSVQILENSILGGKPLQLSRALSPECADSPLCTVLLSEDGFPNAVLNPTEAYKTLFNVSENHRVQSVSVDGQTYSILFFTEHPRRRSVSRAFHCHDVRMLTNVASL